MTGAEARPSVTDTAPLAGIDVVVLAGGLGTRIRAVLGDVPKVLAPVGDRPFLDLLLDWLRAYGARRVVLCLGHLASRVIEHLESRPADGLTVVPVIEPAPLGTAGAIRFAAPQLGSDPVFVLNGDTFVEADIAGFVGRHRSSGAFLSLLCAKVPSIARFGSLELDERGYVARFAEKDASLDRPGLISGGMYLFSADALAALGRLDGPSLERDFLETRPPGTIRAEVTDGRFIDIGTPDSLAGALSVIAPILASSNAPPALS